MELDDLRRLWQHPAGLPAPLELVGLLRQRSASLVGQMRRNTWLEIGLMVPVALATLIALPRLPELRGLLGLLLLLLLGLGYYYYRLLGLLRFYYGLSVAMVPCTLLVVGVQVGQGLVRPPGIDWVRLGLLVGVLAGAGGLLLLLQIPATRWYLQRLYGRHLDRLESQLRELEEDAAARE